MKNSFFITALILLISFTTTAQKNAVPYLDKDGFECVLAYNSVTGVSKRYYYHTTDKVFKELNANLPITK
ncbi:MAG: hypothetical protein P8M05_07665 [Flavobacteriales bacterium]|nr:hypothetical protein [Flavobacteriales bacterium]